MITFRNSVLTPNPNSIFLIGDNLWDPASQTWVIGGEQRLLQSVAQLLMSNGLHVTCVQPYDRWSTWEHESIQWIGIPPKKRSGFKKILWSANLNKIINQESRVIYSYSELLGSKIPSNSVVWQHGVGWDGRSPERRIRSIFKNQKALRKCRAIICVDTNFPNVMASNTQKIDLIHQKCHYIPNFPPITPTLNHRLPPGSLRVAYVRRFGPGRGTDLMVEAARTLWDEGLDFHLDLVGYSLDGSEERYIRERLAPELAQGRATLGPLPFERIHEVYERAHLAVVPTRRGEGTSLACLEAFAFGLPVVATWVGGLPNLVQDGLNGRLVAPTLPAIRQALRELLLDADLRAVLSQGALQTAQRFSRERWEQRVLQLLRELQWLP